jgi:alpha-tubulin suppressor-like RCC1 family protein
VPARLDVGKDWTTVSAGAIHCFGLRRDGSLWAWGDNAHGQLGVADSVERRSPTRVSGTVAWLAVAAGTHHSLGVSRDGGLWAWGSNAAGQLGQNGSDELVTRPQTVDDHHDWCGCTAGTAFSLALKQDGSLWSWGAGGDGQLGSDRDRSGNAPGPVAGGAKWATASANGSFALAIRSDGSVWSWGRNEHGQLGLGDLGDRSEPAQIGTERDWVAVHAGILQSLGVKADGSLWSWGFCVECQAVHERPVLIAEGVYGGCPCRRAADMKG